MNTLPLKPWSGPVCERRFRPRRQIGRPARSAYDQDRSQITADSLLRDRYRVAFQPGCSTGVLTARLAERCDRVIAQDVAASAVAAAQCRCDTLHNVQISQADVAAGLPNEELDLVVFSELGYHFSATQLRELARCMAARMGDNAEFVAVHGLGWSAAQRLSADQVHAVLGDELPLLSVKRVRYPTFRLDIWARI